MAESKVKDTPKAGANGNNTDKAAKGQTPATVDAATGVETAPLPAVEELPDAHQGESPADATSGYFAS